MAMPTPLVTLLAKVEVAVALALLAVVADAHNWVHPAVIALEPLVRSHSLLCLVYEGLEVEGTC